MRCPECGSENHHTLRDGPMAFRRPVTKKGKTWRAHKCDKCAKLFISVQTALTQQDASAWMDLMEAEATTKPTVGSGATPTDT